MRITAIDYEAGWLMLQTNDADAFMQDFKPGEYDIKLHREKRSKTANSYAWALMQLISEKTGLPIIEVYLNEMDSISGVYERLFCEERAVESFRKAFCTDHIGRSVDVISVDEHGWAELLLTYGSSDFDRKHMAWLIDNIVQDCEVLGIETKPQTYVDSLLEAVPW